METQADYSKELKSEYITEVNSKQKNSNSNLTEAKRNKNDEFYTQLSDIENEMRHYKECFKGKVVFCNCDDPEWSNFWKFFQLNFNHIGLKKLIVTHYGSQASAYKLECVSIEKNNGELEIKTTPLKGDGDFRSLECIELLKESDIVVTNPPFSLFREYVAQLIEHDKRFIIIGNLNAITYKETFNLIKDNKLWLGNGFNGGNAYFSTPNAKDFSSGVYNEKTGLVKFRNVSWFTNLEIKKRQEKIVLYKTYKGNEVDYPRYDNCDAINVDKTKDIPLDYDGAMGVPISFLSKHNPNQFKILGLDDHFLEYPNWRGRGPEINGKPIYRRVIIRREDI